MSRRLDYGIDPTYADDMGGETITTECVQCGELCECAEDWADVALCDECAEVETERHLQQIKYRHLPR